MKILQINVTNKQGSTGRILNEIHLSLVKENIYSFIGFGRGSLSATSTSYKIGNRFGQLIHLLLTRLFDKHGLGSTLDTYFFTRRIARLRPDIIHLHNLHGYYINIEILFRFLKEFGKPVVWTFHDCWPFTGHCAYFDHINCNKWKTECGSCPLKRSYPASYFVDNSTKNFRTKKQLFSQIENLTIVPVSHWLKSRVDHSFLKTKKSIVIHNGVDTDIFKQTPLDISLKEKINGKYVLGVANYWDTRKGLDDLLQLRKILSSELKIVIVGLTKRQIESLPPGVIGFTRTQNTNELVQLYSNAEVFINPSILETFGLVTIEAMSCGTPVIVYDSTVSPELLGENTGYVVQKGNVKEVSNTINDMLIKGKEVFSKNCRNHVLNYFDKDVQYKKYIDLYRELLK